MKESVSDSESINEARSDSLRLSDSWVDLCASQGLNEFKEDSNNNDNNGSSNNDDDGDDIKNFWLKGIQRSPCSARSASAQRPTS